MKKLLFLLLLTASLSVTASANNAENTTEPQPTPKEKPSFSLSSDFLTIFTLFCSKEEKADTAKVEVLIPIKEEEK